MITLRASISFLEKKWDGSSVIYCTTNSQTKGILKMPRYMYPHWTEEQYLRHLRGESLRIQSEMDREFKGNVNRTHYKIVDSNPNEKQ